jgi:transcriptional regulator NrdR family protein
MSDKLRHNFMCPFDGCDGDGAIVVDSRPRMILGVVWRRRKCLTCGKLFTTQENVIWSPELKSTTTCRMPPVSDLP